MQEVNGNGYQGGYGPAPNNVAFYDDEIDLRQYAALIWRWSWLLILCAIAAGAAAFVASQFSTPIYQSSSTLLINEAPSSGNANYQDILASQRIATTYAQLMTHKPILDEVAARLGYDSEILFKTEVTDVNVSAVRDTQLINIKVEGVTPVVITQVANTLPDVFIEEIQRVQTARFAGSKGNLQEQLGLMNQQIEETQLAISQIGVPQNSQQETELSRLRNNLSQYQSSYANLLQSFESLRLTEAQSTDTITIVEPAIEPKSPIRPRILLNTLLAAIVGMMLALGAVFLMEYLDDRIRSPEELTRLLGVTWLGSIAQIPDLETDEHSPRNLIAASQPRHPISEAYRGLRTNLQFSNVDSGLKSMLITSANPGEGKTTTSANLAITMAQMGKRVVLVDADLRRPIQHRFFQLNRSPGLTDALLQSEASVWRFVRETQTPNLYILTCGKEAPNPAELLGSRRMQQLAEQLLAEADVVLFDAPPIMAVTDAQVLGQLVEGVLLVVDVDKTQRNSAVRAVELLRQVDIPILGAVLNRITKSSRGYYYYYQQHYYYAEDSDGKKTRKQRKGEERSQRQDEMTAEMPSRV